jgi:hypothetical protein
MTRAHARAPRRRRAPARGPRPVTGRREDHAGRRRERAACGQRREGRGRWGERWRWRCGGRSAVGGGGGGAGVGEGDGFGDGVEGGAGRVVVVRGVRYGCGWASGAGGEGTVGELEAGRARVPALAVGSHAVARADAGVERAEGERDLLGDEHDWGEGHLSADWCVSGGVGWRIVCRGDWIETDGIAIDVDRAGTGGCMLLPIKHRGSLAPR